MAQVLFGLSAEMRWDPILQGYSPMDADKRGIPLFAYERFRGFASALRAGFAEHLVLLGGVETLQVPDQQISLLVTDRTNTTAGVYEVSRGFAIAQLLQRDFGVTGTQLTSVVTEPNSLGNITAIKAYCATKSLNYADCLVATNYYHVPRVVMDLHAAKLPIAIVPAESLSVAMLNAAERESYGERLRAAFGDSPLTRRAWAEIVGAADKLNGTYVSGR